jgi:hypothetical protein
VLRAIGESAIGGELEHVERTRRRFPLRHPTKRGREVPACRSPPRPLAGLRLRARSSCGGPFPSSRTAPVCKANMSAPKAFVSVDLPAPDGSDHRDGLPRTEIADKCIDALAGRRAHGEDVSANRVGLCVQNPLRHIRCDVGLREQDDGCGAELPRLARQRCNSRGRGRPTSGTTTNTMSTFAATTSTPRAEESKASSATREESQPSTARDGESEASSDAETFACSDAEAKGMIERSCKSRWALGMTVRRYRARGGRAQRRRRSWRPTPLSGRSAKQ